MYIQFSEVNRFCLYIGSDYLVNLAPVDPLVKEFGQESIAIVLIFVAKQ